MVSISTKSSSSAGSNPRITASTVPILSLSLLRHLTRYISNSSVLYYSTGTFWFRGFYIYILFSIFTGSVDGFGEFGIYRFCVRSLKKFGFWQSGIIISLGWDGIGD